jgi:4a-hydroxytetrahydrobiopterin dehydratase
MVAAEDTGVAVAAAVAAAVVAVVAVADIAEEQGHHPEIEISYNKVEIELTTHAIGGLSVNDFILASKIEIL